MKQLETRNQSLIMNALSFYIDIGIETYICKKKTNSNLMFLENNEQNTQTKKINNNISSKSKKIKNLEHSFENFNDCNLKKTAKNFVKFFGSPNSKILIIDSPPDMEEDKTGTSFISRKGAIFEKMLNAIDLKKDDIFIVKSIPWRPPGNRYPTMEELKICRPFIFNLIELLSPKIIVCLGEAPTNQIFELDQSILKVRGKWQLLNFGKKFRFNHSISDCYVLSTFNISHLLTRPDLKKYAWEDMKLLRDKIKEIL